MRTKTLICFICFHLAVLSADAVEVRLKATAHCSSPVVKLLDVADLDDVPSTVAQTPLFPAPGGGQSRLLTLAELRELLVLHGVEASGWRFTGAGESQITTGDDSFNRVPNEASEKRAPLSPYALQTARQRVEQAVLSYLKTHVDPTSDWTVKAEVPERDAAQLPVKSTTLTVTGGEKPWIGRQQFRIAFTTPRGPTQIPVTAEVSLPDMIVVAKRPLRRGELLRDTDVELKPFSLKDREVQASYEIDAVLGKELNRSIASGQPIDGRHIQSPAMVRRNELITVYARAPGVRVRSNAKALDNGALGDVISVESLDGKKQRFAARVSGLQEVEIWASGTKAGD